MKVTIFIAALILGACAPTPNTPVVSPSWSQARQQCIREGGRWGRGGLLGLEMCFPHYGDAGKTCTASSQCEGFCDAGTNQCSASSLLGCQTYLDDSGETVAICVD